MDWQPAAELDILRLRARLLARLRAFFAERGVLEVDTPALSAAATPSPALASFETCYHGPGGKRRLYLHTSPEFPMKRLLAAGSGPIYQVCKVFRDGEAGRLHNPEFTLLEWYRPGFGAVELMAETEALLRHLLAGIRPLPAFRTIAYRELFRRFAGVDGLEATVPELRRALAERGIESPSGLPEDDPDLWRDLVLTTLVEPCLEGAWFVCDYPASQAALARLRADDPGVAERFELYLDGIELANGFVELGDAVEQRARFEAENATRRASGLPEMPLDERLLAALEAGLPDCAGIALGFDRLLMYAAGRTDIREVLAFPLERA